MRRTFLAVTIDLPDELHDESNNQSTHARYDVTSSLHLHSPSPIVMISVHRHRRRRRRRRHHHQTYILCAAVIRADMPVNQVVKRWWPQVVKASLYLYIIIVIIIIIYIVHTGQMKTEYIHKKQYTIVWAGQQGSTQSTHSCLWKLIMCRRAEL